MADARRTPADPLGPGDPLEIVEALLAAPHGFDFFYALRRLEARRADLPRIGRARSPALEPVRLGQDAHMEFAPAAISSARWMARALANSHDQNATATEALAARARADTDADLDDGTGVGTMGAVGGDAIADLRDPEGILRLGVAFLGLFGPHGPLPLHLTDYALERTRRHHDRTFQAFADLFHHRLLCLFYRAWASSEPTVSCDRPHEDRFSEYLGALCGLGLPSLRQRDALPDGAKLFFAGHLLTGVKHADGLCAMLSDYFRIPVELREFIGEWLEIAPRDRCLLGQSPATGTLGVTAIAGAYAFECQHRFRLRFGSLTLAQFERLLPGGDSLAALIAVVRNYAGDEYVWDAQLVLRASEVPEPRLGARLLLGWTLWLGTRQDPRDADDLILDPLHAAPSDD